MLDYKAAIGVGIGLDAAAPNLSHPGVSNDPTWTFNLRPDRRHWEYRGNRNFLGFDPSHRLLYFGSTHANEDVWLALVPLEFVGPLGDYNCDEMPQTNEPARMDPIAANAMWAYVSLVLTRIQYGGFAMTRDYPPIASEHDLGLHTDIL